MVPTEAWLQYGGPERCYNALDIGACAVMEITILPKGLTVDLLGGEANNNSTMEEMGETEWLASMEVPQDMLATHVSMCDPRWLFKFPAVDTSTSQNATLTAEHKMLL